MRAISDIGDPRLVKALAHPLRVQILSVLEERTASPSDLAEELGAPLGNVSYHVRTLTDLGLLKLGRARARPRTAAWGGWCAGAPAAARSSTTTRPPVGRP